MLGLFRWPIHRNDRLVLMQLLLHWSIFFEWSNLLFTLRNGPVSKSNRIELLQRLPERFHRNFHGVFGMFSMRRWHLSRWRVERFLYFMQRRHLFGNNGANFRVH